MVCFKTTRSDQSAKKTRTIKYQYIKEIKSIKVRVKHTFKLLV